MFLRQLASGGIPNPYSPPGGTWTVNGAASFTVTDAATNTVTDVITLTHLSTGTVATNFGTGILFKAEDDAGQTEDAGRIRAYWSAASSGSEFSRISFQLRDTGAALADRMTLRGDGVLGISGLLTIPAISSGGLTGSSSTTAFVLSGGAGTTLRGMTVSGLANFTATSGEQSGAHLNYTANGSRWQVSSGSANFTGLDLSVETNQTGSASGNYFALRINVTETALLGTASYLTQMNVGGVQLFFVDRLGQFGQAIGTVTTSDATVTTLASTTIPTDVVIQIEWRVVARRSTGVTGASYIIVGTFRNAAGTVTQVTGSPTTPITHEDDAAYAITMDVNGTAARLRITGVAATTVNWKSISRTIQVA